MQTSDQIQAYVEFNKAFMEKLATTLYSSIHEGIIQGTTDANWMHQANGNAPVEIGFGTGQMLLFLIVGLMIAGLLLALVVHLSTLIDVLKDNAGKGNMRIISLGDKLKAALDRNTSAGVEMWEAHFDRDDRAIKLHKELESVTAKAMQLVEEKQALAQEREVTQAFKEAHAKNSDFWHQKYNEACERVRELEHERRIGVADTQNQPQEPPRNHYDDRFVPTATTYNNPHNTKLDAGYQPVADDAPMGPVAEPQPDPHGYQPIAWLPENR